MGENDDIIKEFLVESHENLDKLDNDLVALEKDPTSKDILARIFRSTHTIKGTCGFFGLSKLQAVSHAGENLLSRLRDGQIHLTPEIATALLAMVDAIRQILGRIENTGQEGDQEYAALIETLNRLQKPDAPPPSGGGKTAPSKSSGGKASSSQPPPPSGSGSASASAQAVDSILEAAQMHTSSVQENHIRVDVGLLDKLMTLVGELVLTRNQILQFSTALENTSFNAATQRLNLITSDLQESVMKTRMQPIERVWAKFPRVVRDLAVACGKQVRLEMEGEDTELDKTLVEAIADPLTHAVRNAVDHGFETPAERAKAGKPPEGRLVLRAFHESGHVNIEITDDGAGINVDKVKQKALSLGLLTPDQAEAITEREATNLIFLPGFSTAERVTNLSGRGVGMDVVKTNIERIGGTIDIQSQRGSGTTLKIKIPLTLAIIPALIVTCSGDTFAIPQVSLLELVRLGEKDARQAIEKIHGVPVYRLRGNLLPLVYLSKELFGKTFNGDGPVVPEGHESVHIVVLQAGDRQFGLVVDQVNDTEEIVVKPLGQHLKNLSVYAGATIMGDGRVALILDVLGLALKARILAEVGDRPFTEREAELPRAVDNRQALLLFRTPDNGQMAIPLSAVARLEEFPLSSVERTGDQDVVQYRGEILPLMNLSLVLPERRSRPRHGGGTEEAPARDTLHVVVYTHHGRSVGLVVDRILDIVEESLTVQSPGTRAGVTGSSVIHGRVTELLDVENLLRHALPGFFPGEEPPKEAAHG